MRNLATLNQLWDATAIATERRTSESFTVKGARLTIALQVQETTLREFFDRSGALARGTGFLARFLIAWPASTQGFRPFTEPPEHWPHLAQFNRRLTTLLEQPVAIAVDGALSPTLMTFAQDAKEAWIAFHDLIEAELKAGGELYDVRDVASKTADNAARLAALLRVFDSGIGVVGAEYLDAATRIAAWHLNEARRFLGELALPVELANAVRLDSWLLDYCVREHTTVVPRRVLQQFGPSGIRGRDTLDAAVRELAELGRVRLVSEGRRKEVHVNPKLVAEDAL